MSLPKVAPRHLSMPRMACLLPQVTVCDSCRARLRPDLHARKRHLSSPVVVAGPPLSACGGAVSRMLTGVGWTHDEQ